VKFPQCSTERLFRFIAASSNRNLTDLDLSRHYCGPLYRYPALPYVRTLSIALMPKDIPHDLNEISEDGELITSPRLEEKWIDAAMLAGKFPLIRRLRLFVIRDHLRSSSVGYSVGYLPVPYLINPNLNQCALVDHNVHVRCDAGEHFDRYWRDGYNLVSQRHIYLDFKSIHVTVYYLDRINI